MSGTLQGKSGRRTRHKLDPVDAGGILVDTDQVLGRELLKFPAPSRVRDLDPQDSFDKPESTRAARDRRPTDKRPRQQWNLSSRSTAQAARDSFFKCRCDGFHGRN